MPHSRKITRGKNKNLHTAIWVHRYVAVGYRLPLVKGRSPAKEKAPFRGPSILLPLLNAGGATGESSAQLVERLPSVPLDKSECFTIKAVSPQVVSAVLAGRPREVRVEGVAPLLGLLIEGA